MDYAGQPTPSQGKLRPMATLLAIATILPELFTGSTPLIAFFNPGVLMFLFFGYGMIVLLIRELAVRSRSSLMGLLFLGLAYSIINEGFLAKTMIIESHLPVKQYDHYGVWLGISFPWAAGIGVWHACASVIFPIQLVHYFFPEVKTQPWLKGRTAILLGGLFLLLSCVAFLGTSHKGIKGTPEQLVVFLIIMFVCGVAGILLKEQSPAPAARDFKKPLLFGFSIFIPFWGLSMLAAAGMALLLFFAVLLAVILAYSWVLRRQHWLGLPAFLYFGTGSYLRNVIHAALIIAISGNPVLALLTGFVDGIVLWLLFRQIRRCESRNQFHPDATPGTSIAEPISPA